MLKTRVIPVLLLKDLGLYKTVQFKQPRYIGDPINCVKIFNEKEVDELIFLDISASLEKKLPNFDLIAHIASECFMPFSYGGGVHSLQTAEKILKLGAEKIIFNTAAFQQPELIKAAAQNFGSQSVIISLDVRRSWFKGYQLFSSSGKQKQSMSLVDAIHYFQDLGAGELMIHNIDREGTRKGYDIHLLKTVTEQAKIPVIACGGANTLIDFKNAVEWAQVSAVAAGACFVLHGKHQAVLITYPSQQELKEYLNE